MIGFIQGKVIDTGKNEITVLTTSGVGYRIFIAANSPYLIQEEAQLYIYTSVKETEISLWGFKDKNDLLLFEYLISVSGVGSKTALALLESKGSETIIRAVINGDFDQLKVSGVGPKTAQKIVIELKTKLAKFAETLPASSQPTTNSNKKVKPILNDAIEALTSLGYREQDVRDAYNKMSDEELESINDSALLIKAILKVI